MIIGLAGYAGVGKDTVGKILVDSYGFKRVGFADKVKELALRLDPELRLDGWEYDNLSSIVAIVGWDHAKRHWEVRRFLQNIGHGVREILGKDAWIDAALSDEVLYGRDVVITDVRYENELETIRDLRGQVWWINRPGVGPLNNHASENSVSEADADETIVNDGSVELLKIQAESLLKRAHARID